MLQSSAPESVITVDLSTRPGEATKAGQKTANTTAGAMSATRKEPSSVQMVTKWPPRYE